MENVGAFFAVAITMLVPAVASALGQGWATSSAVQAMSRQPEAANDIRGALMIALAFMEALTLFSWVIAMIMVLLKL
ncbi:MAG TPA: ATP synthase F0 subunit C [Firmicutes bacterium]|nr:ATP synthase F0 subunit C [Bacillota bacterium]